jgi:hypothetical protein
MKTSEPRVRAVLCAALLMTTATVRAEPPGFATCAAYYFLAARGHGVRDYDRLYSAGEFSLNEATRQHGRTAAEHKMEAASGVMMREMHQDWREIAALDGQYGGSCETLLRDAGYGFE